MDKREFIGIPVHTDSCFVHKRPYRKVQHEKSIELLSHQVRCLAAQYHLRATQMNFKLVQGVFDFPALMI